MGSRKRKQPIHLDDKDFRTPTLAHLPACSGVVNRNADRSKFYLNSPFSDEILLAVRSRPGVSIPHLRKYNGDEDPKYHIRVFDIYMNLCRLSVELQALLFAMTFEGNAVHWFSRLPPASIRSFNDLRVKFLDHFAFRRTVLRKPVHLYSIVQGRNETLRSFMTRFSDAMEDCEDASVDNLQVILYTCLRHEEFSHRLAREAPKSFEDIMDIAEEFMAVEDFIRLNPRRNVCNA